MNGVAFMAKEFCCICGEGLGFLSSKIKIADGVVCSGCLKNVRICSLDNPLSYTVKSIRDLIYLRISLANKFQATKSVQNFIEIDDVNKLFCISNELFLYENLLSFELLEDGQSIAKGGLGRAVVGGLLFGGVGAIVGGITGGKKTKGICNSMKLRVSLKNAHKDVVYISFITGETPTKGFIYQVAQENAQKCITVLEQINEQNHAAQNVPISSDVVSVADEILKYKGLLDQGVITQEEFELKKKDLLNL